MAPPGELLVDLVRVDGDSTRGWPGRWRDSGLGVQAGGDRTLRVTDPVPAVGARVQGDAAPAVLVGPGHAHLDVHATGRKQQGSGDGQLLDVIATGLGARAHR